MVGGVVYKTTDGGENWIEVWRGDNLARHIPIDPQYRHTLSLHRYLLTVRLRLDPQSGDPGGEALKSTDGERGLASIAA